MTKLLAATMAATVAGAVGVVQSWPGHAAGSACYRFDADGQVITGTVVRLGRSGFLALRPDKPVCINPIPGDTYDDYSKVGDMQFVDSGDAKGWVGQHVRVTAMPTPSPTTHWHTNVLLDNVRKIERAN
jgi:hypothetical protein